MLATNHRFSRRDFLKTSIVAVGAAALRVGRLAAQALRDTPGTM